MSQHAGTIVVSHTLWRLLIAVALGCAAIASGFTAVLNWRRALAVAVVMWSPSVAGGQTIDVGRTPLMEIRVPGEAGVSRGLVGMARLSDGSVVIVDSTSPYLAVYDSTGRRRTDSLGVRGRRGRILWLGVHRDTVFLYDTDERQAFAHHRGGVVRIPGFIPDSLAAWRPVARLSDGAVLVEPVKWVSTVRGTTGFRGTMLFAILAPGDLTPTEIGVFPYRYNAVVGSSSGNPPSRFVPSPVHAHLYIAPDGDRVWIGDSDRSVILAYGSLGRPAGTIDLGVSLARPFDPRAVVAARDDELRRAPPGQAEYVSQLFDPGRLPPRQPYFGRLIADADRRVWVKRYNVNRFAIATYDVFEDGRLRATVDLPAGVTPFHIGRDFILALRTPVEGDETVLLLSLTRVGGGPDSRFTFKARRL